MSAAALSTETWLLIASIAAWTVLMSLRTLAHKLEHERRLHEVVMRAKRLREIYYARRRSDRETARRAA